MSVEIRQHALGKDLKDFIRAGHVVFTGDPNWIPPLEMLVKEQLNPKKNPFFEHAEGALFTAWKDGKLASDVIRGAKNGTAKVRYDGVVLEMDLDAKGTATLNPYPRIHS